jgi:hypothetical protein
MRSSRGRVSNGCAVLEITIDCHSGEKKKATTNDVDQRTRKRPANRIDSTSVSDFFLRKIQYAIIVKVAKTIGNKGGSMKLKSEEKRVTARKCSTRKAHIKMQKGKQTNFFFIPSFLGLATMPARTVREKRVIMNT